MRRINFNPEYVAAILSGSKCATVRKGRRSYAEGEVVELTSNGKAFALARVVACEVKRLAELTELDARRDGFSSREELLRALRRIYGGVSEREQVTVVRFKLLRRRKAARACDAER
ncbi:ASCH domain-containing protein [Candidatus Pyrohabitans sp.]